MLITLVQGSHEIFIDIPCFYKFYETHAIYKEFYKNFQTKFSIENYNSIELNIDNRVLICSSPEHKVILWSPYVQPLALCLFSLWRCACSASTFSFSPLLRPHCHPALMYLVKMFIMTFSWLCLNVVHVQQTLSHQVKSLNIYDSILIELSPNVYIGNI